MDTLSNIFIMKDFDFMLWCRNDVLFCNMDVGFQCNREVSVLQRPCREVFQLHLHSRGHPKCSFKKKKKKEVLDLRSCALMSSGCRSAH